MDPPERPLATEIGDAFVEQYYLVMEKFPKKLHKFYDGNSTITRPGHDGTMRTYSLWTLSDIGESLNALSSGGFDSAEVTNVISHACTGGCVMVLVNGYFELKESVKKNFIQTFLLVPQKTRKETKHFVFTDLLVYIDKPEANDGTKVDSKASIPPANNETEVTRSEVAGDKLKDVPKLSYASAVMKETPENQSHHSSCDQSPRREAEAVVDRGDRVPRDWHGILIKNLHSNTTNTKIHNVFQQFGKVARVLNRMPAVNRLVLFIEEDAARKAIEASPIMIEGRHVTVEELLPKWGDRRRGRGRRGRW